MATLCRALAPALALVALTPGAHAGGNIDRIPEPFKRFPQAKRVDLPTLPFRSVARATKIGYAALISGVPSDPQASTWSAWTRWDPKYLVDNVFDYFSSVQCHGEGEGATFYAKNTGNSLNIRGLAPLNSYKEKTVQEFFTCDQGEYHYLAGGLHPTFEKDMEPRDKNFKFPRSMTSFENFYWACKGTHTYLHYDREHVFLIQVTGEKEIILTEPSAINAVSIQPHLHPSARQTAIPLSPCQGELDPATWPTLNRLQNYSYVKLGPGDALYLPPGWFHSVCNLESSTAISLKGVESAFANRNILHEFLGSGYRGFVRPMSQRHCRTKGLDPESEPCKLYIAYHVFSMFIESVNKKRALLGRTPVPSVSIILLGTYQRYMPYQGRFIDDAEVELDCKDFIDSSSAAVAGLRKDAESGLSKADRAVRLLARMGVGRAENELQDAAEILFGEIAVQRSRANAALRALNRCLGNEEMLLSSVTYTLRPGQVDEDYKFEGEGQALKESDSDEEFEEASQLLKEPNSDYDGRDEL